MFWTCQLMCSDCGLLVEASVVLMRCPKCQHSNDGSSATGIIGDPEHHAMVHEDLVIGTKLQSSAPDDTYGPGPV